jgi:hypothetical protein
MNQPGQADPPLYQKYGFKEWPGYIAMMAAHWRAEKAEYQRQLASLSEDERSLYDCLLQAVYESAWVTRFRTGTIEVKPGQWVWPPPPETPTYLLIRDPYEDFWA